MPTGKEIPTFRRIILPPPSGYNITNFLRLINPHYAGSATETSVVISQSNS